MKLQGRGDDNPDRQRSGGRPGEQKLARRSGLGKSFRLRLLFPQLTLQDLNLVRQGVVVADQPLDLAHGM